ncbi:hypothetical protein [Limobrevibacterium gyesilva]|uniref:Uncharacterized protein n=1 Tax=Limobrevibacterium gyesilva TaxID=2991712 RepID=A0AA41YIU6_9PROT|nr:hypothetical protein [Limobrevibacterium gyesilva]MCW3473280.1 hypothetical protein [Limobrevibacterium gyesilva]
MSATIWHYSCQMVVGANLLDAREFLRLNGIPRQLLPGNISRPA